MLDRFPGIFAALLVASFVFVPVAGAAPHTATADAQTRADAALRLLAAVDSIRIGANTTVVTIQDGPKTHPIVIDYAEALQSGVLNVQGEKAASPSSGKGSSPTSEALPKGLSLAQIGVCLLGLTLVSRVVGIARQLVPVRRRR